MPIKTKLTKDEYVKATLTVILNRTYTLYFFIFVSIVVIVNIISSVARGQAVIATILPPVLIFSAYILVIYFSVKRGYLKNKRISESIEYTFEENRLIIRGESFNSELSWDKINKVTLTKNWLLIWQTKISANAIPRKDISESDLANLKIILASNRVKNNL
jgi:hypothetical protein